MKFPTMVSSCCLTVLFSYYSSSINGCNLSRLNDEAECYYHVTAYINGFCFYTEYKP